MCVACGLCGRSTEVGKKPSWVCFPTLQHLCVGSSRRQPLTPSLASFSPVFLFSLGCCLEHTPVPRDPTAFHHLSPSFSLPLFFFFLLHQMIRQHGRGKGGGADNQQSRRWRFPCCGLLSSSISISLSLSLSPSISLFFAFSLSERFQLSSAIRLLPVVSHAQAPAQTDERERGRRERGRGEKPIHPPTPRRDCDCTRPSHLITPARAFSPLLFSPLRSFLR